MAAFDALDEVKNGEELVEVRLQLQDIARSEITRHRTRLASLTTEQQSAVEALLISTADLISHQVIDRIQSYPEAVRQKYVNVWSGVFAA
jgi:glutamyl-tRNA reductase